MYWWFITFCLSGPPTCHSQRRSCESICEAILLSSHVPEGFWSAMIIKCKCSFLFTMISFRMLCSNSHRSLALPACLCCRHCKQKRCEPAADALALHVRSQRAFQRVIADKRGRRDGNRGGPPTTLAVNRWRSALGVDSAAGSRPV